MEFLAKLDSINAHADRAIKNNFKALKDIGNKAKISPAQEDIPCPCISSITKNVAEVALPVHVVRVPAHQVLDRKFVTVARKRRKQKDYQTDCKAS